MEPYPNMEAIINRVRYRVADSTLLAHDYYWDGHNMERNGRNVFLYRSPGGRYFAVHVTLWEGERDRIEPLGEGEAYDLYEHLPEHEVRVEEAFPTIEIVDA